MFVRYGTEARSTVAVPVEPVEVEGRYGTPDMTFRPEYWQVGFGWQGDRVIYHLCGRRLTNAGKPYATGQIVDTAVPPDEVPEEVRRDLAAKLQADLDVLLTEERVKIAKVLEGL